MKTGTQQVEPGEYVLSLQQDSVQQEGELVVTVADSHSNPLAG